MCITSIRMEDLTPRCKPQKLPFLHLPPRRPALAAPRVQVTAGPKTLNPRHECA